MNKELLLEIGTEEIPASYMGPALSQIKDKAQKHLTDAGFNFSKIQVVGTPRRMVLYIENLEAQKREAVHDLKKILPRIINAIYFPKSMRWHDFDVRFARPLRWIVSLYDNKVVHFDFEGIKPDKYSYGHRFLAPEKFEVKNFKQYQEDLKKKFVIVDQKERKNLIKAGIEETAKEFNGRIMADDKLLETVNWLVEYPVVLLGNFKKEFLELPKEVLITSMKSHQKYFSLVDSQGNLLPFFITISNMKVSDPKVIVKGNEKVLTARLTDAKFLYNADKKITLEKRANNLKKVVFQEKLGSMWDKTQRMVKLVDFLSILIDRRIRNSAMRAAFLSKADLTTEMVGEFPDLQGIMGKYYAQLAKEEKTVAEAISEHYLPRFANDALPTTKEGAIVSLADKIDSLVGYFGIGLIPTSTEDPYALRRQALGVLLIIWNNEFKISLEKLISRSLAFYGFVKNNKKTKKKLLDFIAVRLENLLESKKFSKQQIEAVLSMPVPSGRSLAAGGGFDDLVLVKKKIEALNEAKNRKEFESLKSAMKRVNNILAGKISKKKVSASLLQEQAEKDLYKIVLATQNSLAKQIKAEDYKSVLRSLMELSHFINKFFDQVLVMAKSKKVKENRIALLSAIYKMAQEVVDFRKLI